MPERNVFILAAGRGSRLRLDVPKAMAPLGGKSILDHTLGHLNELALDKRVCIVGHRGGQICKQYGGELIYRYQEILNGNAGAILAGFDLIPIVGSCLVVHGDDSAFVSSQTYLRVYETHYRSEAKITALLSHQYDPNTQHRFCQTNLDGRIIRCRPINPSRGKPDGGFFTGVYCFESSFLKNNLLGLSLDISGEIGIPQLINLAISNSQKVMAVWDTNNEWRSINTPQELAIANQRVSMP